LRNESKLEDLLNNSSLLPGIRLFNYTLG